MSAHLDSTEGRTAAQLLAGRWLRWCLTNFASVRTRVVLRSLLNTTLSLPPSRPCVLLCTGRCCVSNTPHRVRKAITAISETLRANGDLPEAAAEYAERALQLDGPGTEATSEGASVTLAEMELKINRLLGTPSTTSTPLGVLPSGALPELTLPDHLDRGESRDGDVGTRLLHTSQYF